MTLTEFLLARIAEDEAACLDNGYGRPDGTWVDPFPQRADYDCMESGPIRWLAECEAKRRIVELHEQWPVLIETEPKIAMTESVSTDSIGMQVSKQILWTTEQAYRDRFGEEPPTAPMVLALAQVYAEHPDFDPAWRS